MRPTRCVLGGQAVLAALLLAAAMAAIPAALGSVPADLDKHLNLTPDSAAKSYRVVQVGGNESANVFYPGDALALGLQFVNQTAGAIHAEAKAELYRYVTEADEFRAVSVKEELIATTPFHLELAARGYANVTIQPPLPARFGAYVVVVDVPGHGRQLAAGLLRVPPATPGKVQHPSFAMDIRGFEPVKAMMWKRLGIKGTRLEVGFCAASDKNFAKWLADTARGIRLLGEHDITCMLTLGGGGSYDRMPLGCIRSYLNEKGEGNMNYPGDFAWEPNWDGDFRKTVAALLGELGWPKGPVNAVELWNEPWEGLSISGWGADVLRYREIYTAMAQGVEDARAQAGADVLIGGCCSSMNTEDKLFCDGKDTFLKWLDFTSIHYQPLNALPALIPEWAGRQGPNGPVRVWDTETWIANSEGRVAPVIASMRAQGQSRTAGVLHDVCNDLQNVDIQVGVGKTKRIDVVQVWAPAAGIASMQHFLGERKFRELLFRNGLPWVFVFDGLSAAGKPNPEDGTLVVVGDLGGAYPRDYLKFRSVLGLTSVSGAEQLRGQLARLPANAPAHDREVLEKQIQAAEILKDGSLTLADPEGLFTLYDFYGNPVARKDGKVVVPLEGLGYFVRGNGSPGSFRKLVAAVSAGRIAGYQPVEIKAKDFLARIESGPELRLVLTNVLNRPVTGELAVAVEGLSLPTPECVVLLGNETKEVVLRVTGGHSAASNSYPLAVTFDAGADGKVVCRDTLHVNVISRKTVAVDGDLKDWAGVLPQTTAADAGLGRNLTEKAWLPFVQFDSQVGRGLATGYLAYDDQNFYFAAKIADDTPDEGTIRYATRDDDSYFYPAKCFRVEGKQRKELVWPEGVRRFSYRRDPDTPSNNHGDSVQVAFGVFPPGENGILAHAPGMPLDFQARKCTDYEYVFNSVAQRYGGGTELWRLAAPGVPRKHFYPRQPKAEKDGGPVPGGKLVMRRAGNTRIVEAAIPWAELPDVRNRLEEGRTVRFSYRVNNNQGPAMELAAQRSVSQINVNAFHDYWSSHWSNELEFAFEK
jgi:hypothetical protein